jgi:hypothetical protein
MFKSCGVLCRVDWLLFAIFQKQLITQQYPSRLEFPIFNSFTISTLPYVEVNVWRPNTATLPQRKAPLNGTLVWPQSSSELGGEQKIILTFRENNSFASH